jgi:hypothetical protein
MADNAPSTIVPPTPTVTQSHTGPVTPPAPPDTSPGIDQLQAAFDKVYPMKGDAPKSPPPATEQPPKTPAAPVSPPDAPKEPAPDVKPPEVPEHKFPSFLEDALKIEPKSTPSAPVAEEDFPEELPVFKTPEESKQNWRRLREEYKAIKGQLKKAQETPRANQDQINRAAYLESQNKEMATMLTRLGVEQSTEFQNNIIRPLYASWNEAAKIVQESGADPNELARAMTLSGKPQFEALDNLFSEMPESAKQEVHDALRTYRKFEDARRAALANAPQTFEGIRKREIQRQYQELDKQREEMKGTFDQALKKLRDEVKVEIFQRTNEEGSQWWNEQGDRLINAARNLYLENTDMGRVAMACLLAPAADIYRNLWTTAQKKVSELQKVINDKFGNEPTLSESGGSSGLGPEQQLESDLKRPFSEVFLREFHKAQQRSR